MSTECPVRWVKKLYVKRYICTDIGWNATCGGDRYIYGVDHGDGSMAVYSPPNSLSCVHSMCTALLCQSCLDKVFFRHRVELKQIQGRTWVSGGTGGREGGLASHKGSGHGTASFFSTAILDESYFSPVKSTVCGAWDEQTGRNTTMSCSLAWETKWMVGATLWE